MLTFKFSGADGVMTVAETLTSGMIGKQVKLEFTSDWDNLTKTAVFEAGDISVAVNNVGDSATIPEAVLTIPRRRLKIGIYGEDAESNITPTIYATGPRIEEGADPWRAAAGDPPMPKWKELEERIENLENGNTGGGTGGGSGSDSTQKVNLPLNEDGTPNYGTAGYYAVSDGAGGITWVAAGNTGGGSGEVTTHGIVWDLVNVTSSNPVASVNNGASLSAVLTPADGYRLGDVTVTMGGEVLAGAWNADTATVTIASVTGDVMISCAGVEIVVVDTSPVIYKENTGIKTTTGAITTNATYTTGLCVARYYFTPNTEAIKNSEYYDATNDYANSAVMGAITYHTPGVNYVAEVGSVPNSNHNKICWYLDDTKVQVCTNGHMNTDPYGADGKTGGAQLSKNVANNIYANNIAFTLSMYDLDDSYAYWVCDDAIGLAPVGVRNGDILFAGRNTPYYGMTNINEAETGISYDDDVAQDYSIATTSILGEELAYDPNYEYGLSADFAAVIDEVKTAWMIEYGGNYRKIPIIVTTDQHGRTTPGIFNMLGKTLSMYDVSKIMNLGDTVSVDWYDADEAHPLLSNTQLENWCESVKAIPFSKQLNVFGNHDCCYGNYEDEGNPIGIRYVESQAHLYQYFRNIYARRTNNNGWFSVKDDAFNVKYVVFSLYEWGHNGTAGAGIHTKQMEWFIDELSKDDGYDIVIVSHEPFNLNCATANYPTNGTLQDVTWARGIALEAVINARMNKASGTTADADGVSHTFDFSGCTSELLCSLHGHTHEDQYAYTEGGMLQNTFDWFANNTFFFALIDRVNRVLNVWKIDVVDGVPAYINYQIPLDKPAE